MAKPINFQYSDMIILRELLSKYDSHLAIQLPKLATLRLLYQPFELKHNSPSIIL